MTQQNNSLIDPKEIAELAAEMGATVANNGGNNASRLPELKINTQADNDEGKTLPRGAFYFKGLDKTAYMDTAIIRPLSHTFQYLHYDSQAKRLACKSLIIPHFGIEARDTNGTIRCGKPKNSELMDLPEKERERFKDVTCFRQIRGLVTGVGKTVDGEEIAYDNQPAIIMAKGSNFMPFNDQFMKAIPKGRNFWDYNAVLSSQRHKNGSVVWYTFEFAPDLKNPVGLDENVLESIKAIRDAIRGENKRIEAEYLAALRNQNVDQAAIEAIEGSLDDDLVDAA